MFGFEVFRMVNYFLRQAVNKNEMEARVRKLNNGKATRMRSQER